MRKKFIALGIVQLVLIFFLIFLQFTRYNSPHFFPLDDPEASYTIVKQCPGGEGWIKKLPPHFAADVYCVEYEGKHVFDPLNKKTNFYRVTVGQTRQELEPFLNKKVVIESGEFINSSLQCVKDLPCNPFSGLRTVLNIYSLSLK